VYSGGLAEVVVLVAAVGQDVARAARQVRDLGDAAAVLAHVGAVGRGQQRHDDTGFPGGNDDLVAVAPDPAVVGGLAECRVVVDARPGPLAASGRARAAGGDQALVHRDRAGVGGVLLQRPAAANLDRPLEHRVGPLVAAHVRGAAGQQSLLERQRPAQQGPQLLRVLLEEAVLARFGFAPVSHRDENERGDLPLRVRVGPTWSSWFGQRIVSGTAPGSGFADQVGQVPAIPGKAAHDRGLLSGFDTHKLQGALVFPPPIVRRAARYSETCALT
jgi:hypothetical protein